ncbi:UNVERIFIED_CONTAM: hypothetical protein K2H54_055236 [Gekko kuhli]
MPWRTGDVPGLTLCRAATEGSTQEPPALLAAVNSDDLFCWGEEGGGWGLLPPHPEVTVGRRFRERERPACHSWHIQSIPASNADLGGVPVLVPKPLFRAKTPFPEHNAEGKSGVERVQSCVSSSEHNQPCRDVEETRSLSILAIRQWKCNLPGATAFPCEPKEMKRKTDPAPFTTAAAAAGPGRDNGGGRSNNSGAPGLSSGLGGGGRAGPPPAPRPASGDDR